MARASYNPSLTRLNDDGTPASSNTGICGNVNNLGLTEIGTSVWSFTTDAYGAASFSVRAKFTLMIDAGSPSAQSGIRFNITSSDSSYRGKRSTAGVNTSYGGDGYWYSATVSKKLMPNTKYYLWVYPGSGFYSTWYVSVRLTLYGMYGTPSTINASNGTFGTDKTITLTRSVADVTHTVTVACGGITKTLATKSSATSFVWETDLEEYANAIRTSKTATATITCITYFGTANWGTTTKSITMTFPDDELQPALATGWVTLTADNSAIVSPSITNLVQGYSKIVATFDLTKVTCACGATVSALQLTVAGNTLTASPGEYSTVSIESATLMNPGQLAVECVVIDSRQISNGATTNVTCWAYSNPSITEATAYRCTQSGVADDNGTYLRVNLTGVYAEIDNQNTVSTSIAFKARSDPDYGTETAIATLPSVANYGLDPDITYYARITLTDLIGNSGSFVVTIPTQKWLLKAKMSNGDIAGVAIGKAPETSNALEIPGDWNIIKTENGVTKRALFDGDAGSQSIQTYSGVEQLNLIYGSATIAGTYAALPDDSMILTDAAQFLSSELPNANGSVEIVKTTSSGDRGWIEFHGKRQADGDYRMCLNDSNIPDGTWLRMTNNSLFVREIKTTSITVNANSGNNTDIAISKTGYTALGVVGFDVTGSGSASATVRSARLTSDTTANIVVLNISSTNRTWTASVHVLYVKN